MMRALSLEEARNRFVAASLTSVRMCARCGSKFQGVGREYVCPGCKAPHVIEACNEPVRLSFREQQVLDLIEQAKTNKEIAFELCLTVGTVKEYLHHIFRKLGVTNRTELALWGRVYLKESATTE